MAIGDDAKSVGFHVVPDQGVEDAKVKWGAREINRTRDYIAQIKKLLVSPPIGGRPVGDVNSSNRIGLRWNGTYPVFKVDVTEMELAKRSDLTTKANTSQLAGKANASGNVNQVRHAVGTTQAHEREAGSNRYSVWVDGDHIFGRATSSIRYKDQVEPWNIDPKKVLALAPKRFHRKVDPAHVRDHGLIAEEVHAQVPEIIQWWKNPHEPAAQPVIDGIHYELLSVALLAVVKDQEARIAALESKVQAIEARLDNA